VVARRTPYPWLALTLLLGCGEVIQEPWGYDPPTPEPPYPMVDEQPGTPDLLPPIPKIPVLEPFPLPPPPEGEGEEPQNLLLFPKGESPEILVFEEEDTVDVQIDDVMLIKLGQWEAYYPWYGYVIPDPLSAGPGDVWNAKFDFKVDLRRLEEFAGLVEKISVVLVGEPVFDAEGHTCGLTAITLSSAFTSAGIPLSYYQGTLPVRALGDRGGSPFEAVVEFEDDGWSEGRQARFAGRWQVQLPDDIPAGFYRPHVSIFAHIKGSNTPVDLGHLPYQLGQWLEDNLDLAGPSGWSAATLGYWPGEPIEFMHDPQVLPDVVVGEPATPRIAWTVFQDVEGYGQSGLLSEQDAEHLGLLNRVRYPTPLVMYPGTYRINPGIPTLFPEAGLAGLFIGEETVVPAIANHMDFEAGWARASLVSPDGTRTDLGELKFTGASMAGPVLEDGGFEVALEQTGEYALELVGRMKDLSGRGYRAGGTYRFTVALPLSFSTPVKPGTNFLAGARYPAAAHVNPPIPADVSIEVTYLPNSDEERAVTRVFEGTANRFGHFTPEGPPLEMPEPGEYRSLVTARYVDARGMLWKACQASAGVVAEHTPELVLHGGRTYISPPAPDREHYGGWDRYQLDFEGGSSYLDEELLSQFDHVFPYYSGDTLFVATTYPFESVVGIVLSMEARNRNLARRLVEAYNPSGEPLNYVTTPRWREPTFLPDGYKFGEDNFGYYRISAEHPDHLPILGANAEGLNPLLFTDDNRFEAYTYLSVIRPGFTVMSLAYSGSFMGPCWIVSPNPYGGQINTSPNGDLPGDIYRIMAGLVVKDLETGENHYDAYSAAISTLPPGSYATSVSAPGERPLMVLNDREFPYSLGMDTSDVFMVGDDMRLGGTVMPPVSADISITVTRPDGEQQVLAGRANRLGGFGAPEAVAVDEPGVYRVAVDVQRAGKHGDIAGSGDGEFFHFAIPEDGEPFLEVDVPAMSAVEFGEEIVVPLLWPDHLENPRLTWSVMMPGTVLDEGALDLSGTCHELRFDPRRAAMQYPFIDTVDYANGEDVYGDTIVFTVLFEADAAEGRVYDAVRVILRGNRLFNPRALFGGDDLTAAGHPGHPGANMTPVDPYGDPAPARKRRCPR